VVTLLQAFFVDSVGAITSFELFQLTLPVGIRNLAKTFLLTSKLLEFLVLTFLMCIVLSRVPKSLVGAEFGLNHAFEHPIVRKIFLKLEQLLTHFPFVFRLSQRGEAQLVELADRLLLRLGQLGLAGLFFLASLVLFVFDFAEMGSY